MPGPFVELAIEALSPLPEEVVAVMNQLGFEGFWEDGAVLKCYMASERWSDAILDEVASKIKLLTQSSSSTLPHLSVRTIPEENWNEKWEQSIRPIHATEKIVISPTWQKCAPAPGEIVLWINPKMSFGTGYHESTRLALRMIERLLSPGMTVLDIGTGTGVLAIASVLLGASRAAGVDNDEWAYANAKENVDLNGVQDRVTIIRGELETAVEGNFDLIAANIQRDVIEHLLPGMKLRLRPGGTIVLAGLLVAERTLITKRLQEEHLTAILELEENEWLAIACRG